MAGNLPSQFLDEVRNYYDIVQFVSEYVQLKRAGRNYFGLCPFHGEKTPSFSVSPDKQIFHCFGCGEGGDVFSFIMKADNLTFPEAVTVLAKRVGISPPQAALSPAEERTQRTRERMFDAVSWAQRYYRHRLEQPGDNAAQQYLNQRGLSAEAIHRFGLGFAPDSWDSCKQFLLKKGFSEQELLDTGILTQGEKRNYDRFRKRVTFPICDRRGEIIAFGGRILGEGTPKYLNSPETPLFDKSKHLYALHLAQGAIRLYKQAVIFEGYLDVIAAHQAGITNVVASLGTSLTEAQARLLRGQAEEVVIVYDADTAGQAATWRGVQILRQAGCLVKVGRLPTGLDPDDYIRRFGGEVFRREVIGKSQLLVDYQLESLTEHFNPEKDDERIRLFAKISDVLASVENAMEREDYIEKMSARLAVPASAIREELRKKRQPFAQRKQVNQIAGVTQQIENAVDKAPLQLVALWSRFPSLQRFAVELEDDDFPVELRFLLTAAKEGEDLFSPANVLELLPAGRYRQALSRLLIDDHYKEKLAEKAVADCVRLLKIVRIACRRKELAAEMAKLDPVTSKGEIAELSRRWLELRKLEEVINNPREGGKGVG
ncbi:MAG: DNA primase [Dehalococcoidia bacterium]|nr:DNA primase [Bacillota bacterium]MBT9142666.1 DNA primase [Bacillota bacterium]